MFIYKIIFGGNIKSKPNFRNLENMKCIKYIKLCAIFLCQYVYLYSTQNMINYKDMRQF